VFSSFVFKLQMAIVCVSACSRLHCHFIQCWHVRCTPVVTGTNIQVVCRWHGSAWAHWPYPSTYVFVWCILDIQHPVSCETDQLLHIHWSCILSPAWNVSAPSSDQTPEIIRLSISSIWLPSVRSWSISHDTVEYVVLFRFQSFVSMPFISFYT